MLYCGVDLHAKASNFCLVRRRGKRMAEGLVPCNRRGFMTLMASGKGRRSEWFWRPRPVAGGRRGWART